LAQVKIKIPNTQNGEYYAFVDKKGDLVINNKTFKSVQDFSKGRSFVQLKGNVNAMIDKKGRSIGKQRYSDVGSTFEKSGFTLVHFKEEENWSLIDTNGVVLFKSNIQSYDYEYPERELTGFTIDDKKTYVNQKGKIVWQQSAQNR
jgi:hypothetical protein